MEIVIAVDDLREKYRPKSRKGVEVTALDGISFEVARGEFFGLLGLNGAGKTTTIWDSYYPSGAHQRRRKSGRC